MLEEDRAGSATTPSQPEITNNAGTETVTGTTSAAANTDVTVGERIDTGDGDADENAGEVLVEGDEDTVIY
jgi:hypothetical protein